MRVNILVFQKKIIIRFAQYTSQHPWKRKETSFNALTIVFLYCVKRAKLCYVKLECDEGRKYNM